MGTALRTPDLLYAKTPSDCGKAATFVTNGLPSGRPSSPFGLRRGSLRYERACRAGARLRPSGYDAAAFATNGLAEPKQAQPAKAGGARRDRTADLLHAMQALSQLSYGPLNRPRLG